MGADVTWRNPSVDPGFSHQHAGPAGEWQGYTGKNFKDQLDPQLCESSHGASSPSSADTSLDFLWLFRLDLHFRLHRTLCFVGVYFMYLHN